MMKERYPKDTVITLDDFKSEECLNIINNINEDSYSSYWSHLSKLAREKVDNKEYKLGKILWLLADICSMMLKPSNRNTPFEALMINYEQNTRSALAEDLLDEEVTFLEEILEFCNDYRIKARIADILWTFKTPRNIKFCNIAIDNYQEFSLKYDDILDDSKDCWERAIRLSLLIRKPLDNISQKLMNEFNKSKFEDGYHLKWITELLNISGVNEENIIKIFNRLEEFANKFKDKHDFIRARDYFEECKNWTNNKIKKIELTIEVAKGHEEEANMINELTKPYFYQHAIDVYRSIPRKYRTDYKIDKKIDELHKKLNHSNQLSLSYMQQITTKSDDISEIINFSKNHVSNKNLIDALKAFVNLHPSINYEKLRKQSENSLNKFSLSKLFSSTHISSDGRTIAKTDGLGFNNNEDVYEENLLIDMIQSYEMTTSLILRGMITPAFQEITKEHRITKEVLYDICKNSVLIPKDRIDIWIEGLYFGFENNFIVSTHILIPQIEHLVRIKMKENGLKTSTLDANGIETENGLSTLLKNKDIKEAVDKNLVFEFKALLTEQVGRNLRNNVAHGLINSYNLQSVGTIYLWWLCLKLAINSVRQEQEE